MIIVAEIAKLIKSFIKFTYLRLKLRSVGLNVSNYCQIVQPDNILNDGSVYVAPFSTIGCFRRNPDNQFGRIYFGRDVYIGEYCNIRAAESDIIIGNDVMIASGCSLVSSNHGTIRGELMRSQDWGKSDNPIVIGDDVWIAANCCIMPQVSVGKGAVIGAGSIVTKNVPEYEIWAGVPATMIGCRK